MSLITLINTSSSSNLSDVRALLGPMISPTCMKRGQGHNTNEAEASCSEAKGRFAGLEAETLTRT